MKRLHTFLFIISLLVCIGCENKPTPREYPDNNANAQPYSTYRSFEKLVAAEDAKYVEPIRITSPGTKDQPTDHGFWFYNCMHNELHQFDPSGRYLLAMQVSIEGRDVLPSDEGVIGIIDLQDDYRWTEIGRTTAWNWQQGNRLQWVPGSSEEIVWNDRADDGKSFVARIYNTNTKETRTLPRAIYTISPDGTTALTHDFARMKHGGTNYVGVADEFEGQWAPEGVKIWKMNMESGESEPIISIDQMAKLMYPQITGDSSGTLYFFREGFNPSGDRFIFFVKDAKPGERARTEGYTANLDGSDIRYFYQEPSHHFWLDDENIMDNGWHTPPGEQDSVRGYFHFKDDGSGQPTKMYFEAPNGHITISKDGNWILTDTYNMDGFIQLYMYHLPTKKFIPLGKLQTHLNRRQVFKNAGYFRIDLHPRFSPDGKTICIDSSHEGLGRQIYLIDISHIIDNPPVR
jgi:hypothetical protein